MRRSLELLVDIELDVERTARDSRAADRRLTKIPNAEMP